MIEDPLFREEKFIVPYRRNKHFSGRKMLLGTLWARLCDEASNEWSHIIALHGLGGIGKTQLALEYIYSHQDKYDRIYWISAASEDALFLGYQRIAKGTKELYSKPDDKPSQLATQVLRWLNNQDNWLLVIDNLDDVEVIDGYLPITSQQRHVLITTRNEHYHQIPAEGLKVEELGVDEAIELLLARSQIGPIGNTPEGRFEAMKIAHELGCLPLAIEQAAAYIREATKDIFQFLPNYSKNRAAQHSRASRANRIYYKESVATTWHLSFLQIKKNNADASRLLQLLAFMNPDGILTDFLEAGSYGVVDIELQATMADSHRLFEALSELGRFSIIGRQNDDVAGQRITIHRLVQSVIQDEMSQENFATMEESLIELCDSAFPDDDYNNNDIRSRSRRFEDQVVLPLLTLRSTKSHLLWKVLKRVGLFFSNDGKYKQSIELLKRAADVIKEIRDPEHIDTLVTLNDLCRAHLLHGQLHMAVMVGEGLVEVTKRAIGDTHEVTLNAMVSLAGAYHVSGSYEKALSLLERALAARESLMGKEHPSTLYTMGKLAEINFSLGQLEKACALGENVLSARRSFWERSILTRYLRWEVWLQLIHPLVTCEKHVN